LSSLLRLRGHNWRSVTSQLTNSLLDAVLPPVCAGCGRVGELFCDDCRAATRWIEAPVCPGCGRPTSQQRERCRTCQEFPTGLEQIRAATLHVDPIRKVLHKMKYEGFFGLAPTLGQLMVEAWTIWAQDVDLVIPVPLHRRRRWDRGYNQSELLVNTLVKAINKPSIPGALTRHRYTRPQIGLTVQERRDNVFGAFEAESHLVRGKRVMLVDDVLTTGSTLSAAGTALYNAGASAVTAYCLTAAFNEPLTYKPLN